MSDLRYAEDDLALDLGPLEVPDYTPEQPLQERFEAWIAANPHVVTAAERLTAQWLAAGQTRLGIGALVEQLRWHSGLSTSGEVWRINNSYRSRLVRLLVARHPEWAEVFETRTLRAA